MTSPTSTLEQAREDFLSRMSHELRTPLNAVIGFSRVLELNRAGNQRPEDLELLRRVRASGEHLLRLIENVLDQSLLQHGSLAMTFTDVHVCDVAERIVASHRPGAEAKGLHVTLSLPDAVSTVRLDALRFAQVVQHLVDNAIKFSRAGTIRVAVEMEPGTFRPARLVVADTGIGIAPDHLETIFQPFGQVDESRTRIHGGAGLGLPLARRLAESMGCRLTVESALGEGSRFTVHFPGT